MEKMRFRVGTRLMVWDWSWLVGIFVNLISRNIAKITSPISR